MKKKITLGVTSSVAIYKSLDIIRRLKENDCDIKVIMTKNATKLISPLLFETISENSVVSDMWERETTRVEHIELAKWEDLLLVAPATANIIGKFASGIADDFLSTHFLASTKKKVIAPAMNCRMWRNKIVQRNINILKELDVFIIPPKKGKLACGEEDVGALEDVNIIVEKVLSLLKSDEKLFGKRVIVTAGATREYIDDIRFISNPSSGKMGLKIAEEAYRRGANVILIAGHLCEKTLYDIETIEVKTTEDMKKEILKRFNDCDYLFMASAPADFKPKEKFTGKIKRKNGNIKLTLTPTEDILKEISKVKKNQVVIGFAAEIENHLNNAIEKLNEKKVDFIILNDVSRKDIGFESEFNEVYVISKNEKKHLKMDKKENIAKKIIDIVTK